jgi:transposase
MSKLRFVGLDVHKETIVIAVAEEGQREASALGTFSHDVPKLIKRLVKLVDDVSELRVCYEAGPTGFGLKRRLDKAGIHCKAWLRQQKFADPCKQCVMDDSLKAADDATERVRRLSKEIERFVEHTALAPLVKALTSFRGISTLSAVVIAAEIGDLRRFPTARQFMSFVGLVVSEHSSGKTIQRGPLTRTGNGHGRRISWKKTNLATKRSRPSPANWPASCGPSAKSRNHSQRDQEPRTKN